VSPELALAGLAITTVGACRRILDLVVAHVKQRHQFGVPIGSFQAVKHKPADMYVAIERARALAYFSALTIAEDDPRRRRAALMAKAAAGDCAHVVYTNGAQLFGAMGFTWESELHVYLKRALAGDLLLGPAPVHRKALLALTFVRTDPDGPKHKGISVEVIDLRTVAPLDKQTVLESLAKTSRLLIAHEGVTDFGIGAEIAAIAAWGGFWMLDAPVMRVAPPPTPVPYAPNLEQRWLPGRLDIERAIERLVRV
jgi:alkylation response protein AidB-like acyl-CoA dehydrogenase